jgi:hypothetical protein
VVIGASRLDLDGGYTLGGLAEGVAVANGAAANAMLTAAPIARRTFLTAASYTDRVVTAVSRRFRGSPENPVISASCVTAKL